LYQKVQQSEESLVALTNHKLEDVIKSTSTDAVSSCPINTNEKRKDSFQEKGTKGATLILKLPHEKKSDGRMSNSGAPIRQSYTVDYKVEFVESVQAALDDANLTTVTTPTRYFRSIGCSGHDVTTNVARYGKWTKPDELEKLMKRKLANLKSARLGFHRSRNLNLSYLPK